MTGLALAVTAGVTGGGAGTTGSAAGVPAGMGCPELAGTIAGVAGEAVATGVVAVVSLTTAGLGVGVLTTAGVVTTVTAGVGLVDAGAGCDSAMAVAGTIVTAARPAGSDRARKNNRERESLFIDTDFQKVEELVRAAFALFVHSCTLVPQTTDSQAFPQPLAERPIWQTVLLQFARQSNQT